LSDRSACSTKTHMGRLNTKTLIGVAAISCLLSSASVCRAHTSRETSYPYERLWSTTVRFLRVDNGFSVTEQDKETGYILFEYKNAGQTCIGAMELIPKAKNGAAHVALRLRIQNMPTYVETVLMDKLERKLRDEYGAPPAPRRIRNDREQNSEDANNRSNDEDAPNKITGSRTDADGIDNNDNAK
jgi:uncharacterized lipoprotein